MNPDRTEDDYRPVPRPTSTVKSRWWTQVLAAATTAGCTDPIEDMKTLALARYGCEPKDLTSSQLREILAAFEELSRFDVPKRSAAQIEKDRKEREAERFIAARVAERDGPRPLSDRAYREGTEGPG